MRKIECIPMRSLMLALLRKTSGLPSVALLSCILAFQSAIAPSPQAKNGHPSLRELRAHIGQLRSKAGSDNARDELRERREGKGLDYLDALEDYLSVRAYPFDQVDWDAIRQAVAQRDLNIPSGGADTANWEFLGPRNCASPSNWAFGPAKISGRVGGAAFDPGNPRSCTLRRRAAARGNRWTAGRTGAQ